MARAEMAILNANQMCLQSNVLWGEVSFVVHYLVLYGTYL
jgi:hypothetical protein